MNILQWITLIVTILLVIVVIFSAKQYRGLQGERFSIFNFFISELGEVGVSRGARAFNSSLIITGLALLPALVWLGLRFSSPLGWLATAAGILASLGVTAVGLFPVNHLASHTRAAMLFFRAGLAMVLLFGLSVLIQPASHAIYPSWINLLSLVAFFSYVAFLVLLQKRMRQKEASTDTPALSPPKVRSKFRPLAFLEWMVFFTTILWMLVFILLA